MHNNLTTTKQSKQKNEKENSSYAKHIATIENTNFEKIRRHCNNLVNDNQADEMQKSLAQNGKMHKAIIYDALEQFLVQLNGETITLIDWGCDQGITSMLVRDYIREKQLEIKVSQVILIDSNKAKLSRAMTQVEAVAYDKIETIALKSDDNKLLDTIKTCKKNITLNLFANDKMPVDFLNIDYDIFEKDYFMCISNESKEFVDEIYEDITSLMNCHDLSIRDGKIGRFPRYESIFRIDDNKILEKKDDEWLNFLLNWANENIIQDRTYFPRTRQELKQIKKISLRWNRIQILPKEFFNLVELETLELNNNVLEGLPKEIENLKHLKELNLNINSLVSLPTEIVSLKGLKILNIKNNKYLELDDKQISWLIELKQNGCNIIYDKYKFNLGE
jgi:hypothetical protein